jgi:hypothetical protein
VGNESECPRGHSPALEPVGRSIPVRGVDSFPHQPGGRGRGRKQKSPSFDGLFRKSFNIKFKSWQKYNLIRSAFPQEKDLAYLKDFSYSGSGLTEQEKYTTFLSKLKTNSDK